MLEDEVDAAVTAADAEVAEEITVVSGAADDGVALAVFSLAAAATTELDCTTASLDEDGRAKEKVPWTNASEIDETYTLLTGATEVPAADELSTAWKG